MDPELIEALRNDLGEAEYREDRVAEVLGAEADGARRRGVLAPARRALAARERVARAGGAGPARPAAARGMAPPSALHDLIRVFLLGEPVTGPILDRMLPALGASGARALGLVEPVSDRDEASAPPARPSGEQRYRGALSVNPVTIADARSAEPRHWWIISDLDDHLRRRPAEADHVMGVGGATRTLIGQASPRDASRCLDLGTGCGVVALHLALRGRVIATDISARALEFARANARLNGMADRIEFRLGDLFEPVRGERFDLMLSNPPFVITPRERDVPVYAYRDGGMSGDRLAEQVIRRGPELLADGGEMLCLGNWETPWGMNGLSRVREWIARAAEDAPLDAWVVERDRLDPVAYAELWARDGGALPGTPESDRLLDAWLGDFEARRIVAVGLGSVRIRRRRPPLGGRIRAGEPVGAVPAGPVIRVEQATGALRQQDLGSELESAFDAGVSAELMTDAEVLAARWILSDAVVEEREHRPGEEAPRATGLAIDRPIARKATADPLLAAAVGACDGELTLAQIADALAMLLEVDERAAGEALVDGVRELAWLGMLTLGR